MIRSMSDESKKPDPVEDLKAGLGLLFRAARGAVDKVPTDKLEALVKEGAKQVGEAFHKVPKDEFEKVVKDSVTEVGRAVGTVAHTIGEGLEEIAGVKKSKPPSAPPPPPAEGEGAPPAEHTRVADEADKGAEPKE
jgi:hypothetical protein